jgi:hypothetical protein
MLQRTDSAEMPAQKTVVGVREDMGETGMALEHVGQSTDARRAELIVCIQAGLSRNQRRCKKIHTVNVLISTFVFSGLIAISHNVAAFIGWCLVATFLTVYLERIVIDAGAALWTHRTSRAERAAVRQLAAMDDTRNVGLLVDILYWTNDKGAPEDAVLSESGQALARLLPRLTEDEVQRLSKEHQGILAGWVEGWDNANLRKGPGISGYVLLRGLLYVMACLGRSSIETPHRSVKKAFLLPTLEAWAAGKAAGLDPVVQQAASVCRDAIKEKIALARSEEQLLRPASSPGAEHLLHPVPQGSQTAPQELLRSDPARKEDADGGA